MLGRIHQLLSSRPGRAPDAHFWTAIGLADLYGSLDHASDSEGYVGQARETLAGDWFAGRDIRSERAYLLRQEGYLYFQSEPARAVALFQQSIDLSAAAGDQAEEAQALLGLARAARNAGLLETAWAAATAAVTQSERLGDPLSLAVAETMLGNLTLADGRFEEAEALMVPCIERLRPLGNREVLSWAMWYLAMAQFYGGRFAAGLASDLERQRVGEGLSSRLVTRAFESTIRVHLGQYEPAAAVAEQTLRDAQAIREMRVASDCYMNLGFAALALGDAAVAREHFRASEGLAIDGRLLHRFHSNRQFEGLASVLVGDVAGGRRLILEDLGLALEGGVALRLASGLAAAACLAASTGRAEQAVTLYHLARQQPFVANSQWYADVIGTRVAAAAGALAPEAAAAAEARGRSLDIWQAAGWLLNEKEAPPGDLFLL